MRLATIRTGHEMGREPPRYPTTIAGPGQCRNRCVAEKAA